MLTNSEHQSTAYSLGVDIKGILTVRPSKFHLKAPGGSEERVK